MRSRPWRWSLPRGQAAVKCVVNSSTHGTRRSSAISAVRGCIVSAGLGSPSPITGRLRVVCETAAASSGSALTAAPSHHRHASRCSTMTPPTSPTASWENWDRQCQIALTSPHSRHMTRKLCSLLMRQVHIIAYRSSLGGNAIASVRPSVCPAP